MTAHSKATRLIWITPDPLQTIVDIARVSSLDKQFKEEGVERLIKYLIGHSHWSPFEMVSACLEINTTRDIGRQILRHRSFHFQEFSQRYALVHDLEYFAVRRQDTKNRQNSIDDLSNEDIMEADFIQEGVEKSCIDAYYKLIDMGVAKECARKVLPEGMTPTRMYMAGTIRDWYHYINLRTGNGTQLEHQDVARSCSTILSADLPELFVNYE